MVDIQMIQKYNIYDKKRTLSNRYAFVYAYIA